MTATCPTCQTAQHLTPAGTIGSHHGTTGRWSRGRWFWDQCAGVGKQPTDAPGGASQEMSA